MKVLCFSSFTYSYLARAQVLYRSLRRHHPDWHLVALITDTFSGPNPPGPEEIGCDECVYVTELAIPNVESWLFRHDVVEACTAVKGPFLLEACDRDVDAVVYLDPDTCVFSPLDAIRLLQEDYEILLTPHQLTPDDDPTVVMDNEVTSLLTGIYNLGFVAIRTGGQGRKFAEWWSRRLLEFCFDEPGRGLFVDQRWCDHVPVFFDKVGILKDPGYNVASWNLSNRRLRFDAVGQALVNEFPLRFWHFTKLGPLGERMTERYAKDNVEVYEIWNWYRRAVTSFGDALAQDWSYGLYSDGTPVVRNARLVFRRRADVRRRFDNPFAVGPGSYREWLLAQPPDA